MVKFKCLHGAGSRISYCSILFSLPWGRVVLISEIPASYTNFREAGRRTWTKVEEELFHEVQK